jgi:sensor histidine kinase YesM
MKNRIFIHITFWLVYLTLETYFEFAWIRTSLKHFTTWQIFTTALLTEVSQFPTKISLIYAVFWIIAQKDKIRAAWLLIPIVFVLFIALAVVLQRMLIVYGLLPYFYATAPEHQFVFDINRVNSSIGDLLFVVGLALAAKQYRNSERNKERERNAVKEKLTAELLFLRNQTNPHFLFNTLNNIYALARKKSDKTPEVVMKLSQLLRFMLYECRREEISVSEEVKVIEDYIALEKIRYQDRLRVEFEQEMDSKGESIAPLILLPFVENAFKHGAGESRFDAYIMLYLRLQHSILYFRVENSKDADTEVRDNIGMGNVRRQLELTYSDFDLQIDNQADRFIVNLTINLRKNVRI